MLLPGSVAALGQTAPAGTLILNQAEVTYFDPVSGRSETVSSNTVVTRVNPVEAIEVSSDQTLHLSPNAQGQFVFFVANVGNVLANPAISLADLSGDFALEDVVITVDANRNGIVDPGERTLTPNGRIDLPVNSEAALIVTFRTPATAQDGQQSVTRLTATGTSASSFATGTVIIGENGLALEKSVNRESVAAGDTLTYTLRLRNRGFNAVEGYSEIDGRAIIIDGATATGVLVRDTIPLNTQLSMTPPPSAADFLVLYHAAGTDIHTYTTSPPVDLSTVDAIAFFKAGNFPAGRSVDLTFSVVVNDTIAGEYIPNTASTWQRAGGQQVAAASNIVRTRVTGSAAKLTFTMPDGTPTESTPLNSRVRLLLEAGSCNTTAAADQIDIQITTDPEGDLEVLRATETGPNTGVFTTGTILVAPESPVVRRSNVLAAGITTIATATAVCAGQTVRDDLKIEPGGYVFDSVTNAPVPNARVIVYDGAGNELRNATTDSNGFYALPPLVAASTYRILVVPPEGYVFPSSRTNFTGFNRNVVPSASYGEAFTIPPTGNVGSIDIPLDPATGSALQLEKSADKRIAQPGDIIVYTLTLTNSYTSALPEMRIRDRLPGGFSYVEGSARLEGQPVAIVERQGCDVTFTLGTVPAAATMKLTYLVTVGPDAKGEKVNVAVAEGRLPGGGQVTSEEASAIVRIARTGVFGDEAVVLGKVFVDFNGNGIQDTLSDPASSDGDSTVEPGVPGVKLQFSTGASVVTDSEGKYSMPGLPSGTHAVALVTRSVPETTVPAVSSTRDMLSPRSRYLRLLPGQVAAEYFALVPRDGAAPQEVEAELERRQAEYAERIAAQKDDADNRRMTYGSEGWIDYYLDRGINSDEASRPTDTEIVPRPDEAASAAGESGKGPRVLARTRNLEAEIRGLSSDLAFIDLKDGDVLDSDTATIRVKGPADGKLALSINGESVPESHVGQRVSFAGNGVQAVEYVAVQLNGGSNRLELTFADPFGNIRQRQVVELLAPGRPAKIELVVPPTASADPSSPIPVLIRIVDAEGRPTFASMDVTLEAEGQGRWGVDDIRITEPGVQIFVDRGEALVDYYPPSLVGTQQIAVSNGLGRFVAEVSLLPDDSQRIIVGVVEGAVSLGDGVEPAQPSDGFAPVTRGVSGELYLKGKIKGGALLTLRYDSDHDAESRLFRDVDPDRYYPVYGDKSERGYDAQSRSQLYVKVERGLNYVLYGDIDIAPQADELELGRYNRRLTGAHAHAELGPVTIDLFAGRTDQNQIIREFRAEGLSGPYDLDLTGFVEGSEVVEILTRDRLQPTVIVNTVRLERYTDYRLDYFSNSILFTDPVPASDDDGNPNFIRITYEVEGDGEAYWIYSGEVRYEVNDRIAVGYREVHSEADAAYDDRRTVRSGYASADLGAYGSAEIELAQSIDKNGESGKAGRIGYELTKGDVTVKARAASIGEGFLDGSTASLGRDTASVAVEWHATPKVDVKGKVVYDRDGATGDSGYGAELLFDRVLSPELTATGGMRYVHIEPGDGGAPRSIPSAVVGGEWRPARFPGLAAKGEIEVDLTDPSHVQARIEASHQATEVLKIYTRGEWASAGAEFLDFAAADEPGGTMKMGLEYRFSEEVRSFSELRSGSQTGFAGGIDGEWKLADQAFLDDVRVYAAFEHFQPYDVGSLLGVPFGVYDEEQSSQTSLATGLRASVGQDGRLALGGELSFKDGGFTAYGQQYWSQRRGDWSWAVENRMAWADTDSLQRMRDHLRVGAALRPDDQSIDGLAVAGIRLDRDELDDIEGLTGYWSAGGSWALDGVTRLTARQAGQYQNLSAVGATGETFMLLGQAGIERDFEIGGERRLRLGLNGTTFYDLLRGDSYFGFGGEIGFVPKENVLISAGYNWSPVDSDTLSEVYTSGPFIRLSVKLDDSLWGFFDNAGLTVPAND